VVLVFIVWIQGVQFGNNQCQESGRHIFIMILFNKNIKNHIKLVRMFGYIIWLLFGLVARYRKPGWLNLPLYKSS